MVRHAAVRELPGYDPHMIPAILLEGASTDHVTPHSRAVSVLLESDAGGTLGAELELADGALAEAGVSRRERKRRRRHLEAYFSELGVAEDAATPRPGEGVPEAAVPEAQGSPELYQGMAELGAILTRGDYELLAAMSMIHTAENLKGRAEMSGPLTVPPTEALPEAVWTHFEEDYINVVMELWTGGRVANLHILAMVTDPSSSEPQLRFQDLRP